MQRPTLMLCLSLGFLLLTGCKYPNLKIITDFEVTQTVTFQNDDQKSVSSVRVFGENRTDKVLIISLPVMHGEGLRIEPGERKELYSGDYYAPELRLISNVARMGSGK